MTIPGDARHASLAVTSGRAVPSVEYQERTAKGIIMDARFSYYGNRVAAKFTKYLNSAGAVVSNSAGGVTDEAWANAAKHYDEDQLAALVSLIALINTYNRINVITRQPAGDYQPGQWG